MDCGLCHQGEGMDCVTREVVWTVDCATREEVWTVPPGRGCGLYGYRDSQRFVVLMVFSVNGIIR